MHGHYTRPPLRRGLFSEMALATLEAAGWSFFDDLAGDLSAPDAIPMGGMSGQGMFGDHTAHVPREWEAHALRMERLRQCMSAAGMEGIEVAA